MTDTINELAKEMILSKMAENATTVADFTALGFMRAFIDTPEIKTLKEYDHYKAERVRLLEELVGVELSSPEGIQVVGLLARIHEYETKAGLTIHSDVIGPMQ